MAKTAPCEFRLPAGCAVDLRIHGTPRRKPGLKKLARRPPRRRSDTPHPKSLFLGPILRGEHVSAIHLAAGATQYALEPPSGTQVRMARALSTRRAGSQDVASCAYPGALYLDTPTTHSTQGLVSRAHATATATCHVLLATQATCLTCGPCPLPYACACDPHLGPCHPRDPGPDPRACACNPHLGPDHPHHPGPECHHHLGLQRPRAAGAAAPEPARSVQPSCPPRHRAPRATQPPTSRARPPARDPRWPCPS